MEMTGEGIRDHLTLRPACPQEWLSATRSEGGTKLRDAGEGEMLSPSLVNKRLFWLTGSPANHLGSAGWAFGAGGPYLALSWASKAATSLSLPWVAGRRVFVCWKLFLDHGRGGLNHAVFQEPMAQVKVNIVAPRGHLKYSPAHMF